MSINPTEVYILTRTESGHYGGTKILEVHESYAVACASATRRAIDLMTVNPANPFKIG